MDIILFGEIGSFTAEAGGQAEEVLNEINNSILSNEIMGGELINEMSNAVLNSEVVTETNQ